MSEKITEKSSREYMGTVAMFDRCNDTLKVGVMAFRYIYNKGLWEDFGKYADEKFREMESDERNDVADNSGA